MGSPVAVIGWGGLAALVVVGEARAAPRLVGGDAVLTERLSEGEESVGRPGDRVQIRCRVWSRGATVEWNDPGLRGLAALEWRPRVAGQLDEDLCGDRPGVGTPLAVRDRYLLGLAWPFLLLVGGDGHGLEMDLEVIHLGEPSRPPSVWTHDPTAPIRVVRAGGPIGLDFRLVAGVEEDDARARRIRAACAARHGVDPQLIQLSRPVRVADLNRPSPAPRGGAFRCGIAP